MSLSLESTVPSSVVVTQRGVTPLFGALVNDHTEMAKLLVEGEADVNQSTNIGWTPLHVVASMENDNEEALKLLIEANADVNAVAEPPDQEYVFTPILVAVASRQAEKVKLLIDARADVDLAKASGNMCCHFNLCVLNAAMLGAAAGVVLTTTAGLCVPFRHRHV